MEKQVYFTVDSDELISLRDFGYLADDELEDAEAITNALHTVISDLWKMKVETEKPNRQDKDLREILGMSCGKYDSIHAVMDLQKY